MNFHLQLHLVVSHHRMSKQVRENNSTCLGGKYKLTHIGYELVEN